MSASLTRSLEKKRYAALVLAQSWHTRGMLWPNGAPDLRHQFAEPLIQALVDKTAASKLAIKPCVVFPVHRHRSSRESVPDKESRSIPVTQHFVRSSDHSAKCG